MSIKIIKEIELEDFQAWSGGLNRLDRIKELEILDEAQQEIEDFLAGTGAVTETTINDILWFDMDDFINQYEDDEEE